MYIPRRLNASTHTHTPISAAPPFPHKQDGKSEGGEEKKPEVKENKFLKLTNGENIFFLNLFSLYVCLSPDPCTPNV
jgi:hypothetical protein